MVKLFLDGGEFMWPILVLLIIGLAFVIERFWTLTRNSWSGCLDLSCRIEPCQ
jgi:biopolymer transport protein ExbB